MLDSVDGSLPNAGPWEGCDGAGFQTAYTSLPRFLGSDHKHPLSLLDKQLFTASLLCQRRDVGSQNPLASLPASPGHQHPAPFLVPVQGETPSLRKELLGAAFQDGVVGGQNA